LPSSFAAVAKTIDYVQSARPVAFEGAEDRAILFPLIENLVFDSNGFEYLRDWALPHFYFHVVTAALLKGAASPWNSARRRISGIDCRPS
jgi:hypothetical protein